MMKMVAVPSLPLFVVVAITIALSSTGVSSSTLVWPSDNIPNEDLNGSSSHLRKLENGKHSPGMERCLEDKVFSERVEIGTQCVCRDKTGDEIAEEDRGIILICSDQCAFCNHDRTVCGIQSEQALYDNDTGSKIGIGQVFQYLKLGEMTDYLSSEQSEAGDDLILGIEEINCIEEDTGSEYIMGQCANCNVYFGGTKCNACDVTECGNAGSGVFAPIMDCTNIQEDAVFDFCSDISMEDYSFFQAFRPDQFQRCLPMKNLLDQ